MGARVQGNVLTLPAVRPEDAGVYACVAANHRGQQTAYYVLKVQGEDRQRDGWMGVGMMCPAPPYPPFLQSTWSPTLGSRPSPSSPCPPSRTPTRGLRSSSPSDLMLPMVSPSTPCVLCIPLHVPFHHFPLPCLHASLALLYLPSVYGGFLLHSGRILGSPRTCPPPQDGDCPI